MITTVIMFSFHLVTNEGYRHENVVREDFKKKINGKQNDIGDFSVRPPYPKDIVT